MTHSSTTGIYLYPWSLQDEGPAALLSQLKGYGGFDRVSVPFQYHSGKFFHPHSPRPRTYFVKAGHHFTPNLVSYEGLKIQPVPSLYAKAGTLGAAREAARDLGFSFAAWIVVLHNSALGGQNPEVCQTNVYGDALEFALCPSDPDVLAFHQALVEDVVTNYEPEILEIESVEYAPFTHDHHHELTGVAIGPVHDFLLSLDFNPATVADMSARGVQVDRVRDWAREKLDRYFGTGMENTGFEWDRAVSFLFEEPELWNYLNARVAIVNEFAANLAKTAHRLRDLEVAVMQSWWRPHYMGWIEGHVPARLARTADVLEVPFYSPSALDIQRQARELVASGVDPEKTRGLLMAIEPFVNGPGDVGAAVNALAAEGISDVNFYHHSFVREEVLRWIATERGAGQA